MSSILQYKIMNEFHFVKAIQTSGLTLKEYTLNSIKVRFELDEFLMREFGIRNVQKKLVLNRLEPFKKIQYSIKKTIFNLVYIPKGHTCEVYQMPEAKWLGSDYGSSKFQMIDDLFISESDITVELWLKVMGAYPKGYDLEIAEGNFEDHENKQNPITAMTPSEAKDFCNRLSTLCGLKPCYPNPYMVNPNFDEISPVRRYNLIDISANGFRLPTLLEYLYVAKVGYTIKDYMDYVSKNCEKLKTKECIYLTHTHGYGGTSTEKITKDDILNLFEIIVNIDMISESVNTYRDMFAFCFNGITPQVLSSILDQIDPEDVSFTKSDDGEIGEIDFKTALSNMKFKEKVIEVVRQYEVMRSKIQTTKSKNPNSWGIYDATSNVLKLTQDSRVQTSKHQAIHDPQRITYFDYLKEEYGSEIEIRYGTKGHGKEDISSNSIRVLKNNYKNEDVEEFVAFGEVSEIDLFDNYGEPQMFLNRNTYGILPHVERYAAQILKYSGFKIVKQVPKDPKNVPY